MRISNTLLIAAMLSAAAHATAAPAPPQPSSLPAVSASLPCADGMTSKECDIRTMISVRSLALQEMWRNKRYAELDQALLSLCGAGTHLPDGQPELLVFEYTFDILFREWKQWDAAEAKLATWRAQSPGSVAQALAETMFWSAYAWHGRGSGYASKVPPEAWELFRERMGKAAALLANSKAKADTCPLWHSLNIATLIQTSKPRAMVDAAYAEAVRAFPASQQIHFAMSQAMQPKWGAAEGDFDRFARRAIGYTHKTEGSAIYARLYWSEDCNCDDALTFGGKGDPDWKLLKAGFEELLTRYPDEIYNRNKYASFACRANDRTTYLKLRRELGGNIVDALWPSSWKVDVCDRRMTEKT